jgi:hypothetical protein
MSHGGPASDDVHRQLDRLSRRLFLDALTSNLESVAAQATCGSNHHAEGERDSGLS